MATCSATLEYLWRCRLPSDIYMHLPRLHAETLARSEPRVIELGVRSGNSTAAFLAALEQTGGRGHVWSVDISPPPPMFVGHPCWTFVRGDDLQVASHLPDAIDVLFVDTIHHYSHTLAELAAYMPKLADGGVALFHDTELEQPDGSPNGDPPFPVRCALDDYCAKQALPIEYVTGCYGLGVISIPQGWRDRCTKA